MQLLVRPDPFSDESLESYLLRLSQDNGFENYKIFSGSIKEKLQHIDHEAAGVFPLALSKVNLFHAVRSSGLRIRALRLIGELAGKAFSDVLHLAIIHSAATFGRGYKAVHRAGVDIPLHFIRTRHIPCCPECLSESEYIRQTWHYAPYTVCHRHGKHLLFVCPACGESLNYMRNEAISHCNCGFDLRKAATTEATEDEINLSVLLSGALFESTHPLMTTDLLSLRYGALLWFTLRYQNSRESEDRDAGLSGAMEFFATWPGNFLDELQQQMNDALYRQIKPIKDMSLNDVFGSLLMDCRQLPVRDTNQNFVLRTVLKFLTELVVINPRSRIANPGDLLLSALDAASLLSTSVEQIHRLQDEGFLSFAIKPASKTDISPAAPIYRLRHIIEYRLCHPPFQHDRLQTHLPAW